MSVVTALRVLLSVVPWLHRMCLYGSREGNRERGSMLSTAVFNSRQSGSLTKSTPALGRVIEMDVVEAGCVQVCRTPILRGRLDIHDGRRRTSASAGNRGGELRLGLLRLMGIDVGGVDRLCRLPRI